MTTLLKKALNKISKLPDIEQDEIARIILEEIEDENIWSEKFKNSQNSLSNLADEAVKEYKSGKTKLSEF